MGETGHGRWMFVARFCTALRFLTLAPVSWRAADDGHHFPASLPYFVPVGMLVGVLVASVAGVFSLFLPQGVTAMLAIAMLAGVSGFLHLDGLADSADGLLSSRPREMRLEIMKDSRSGAMGIVAVVLVLLTKYAALSAMPVDLFLPALLLMPMAGRSAILLMMAGLPYARKEGGLGSLFYSGDSKKAALFGLVLLAICLAPLGAARLVSALVVFGTVVAFFSWWCRASLGGATGDTLGAVCELAEAGVAVAMTVSLARFFP